MGFATNDVINGEIYDKAVIVGPIFENLDQLLVHTAQDWTGSTLRQTKITAQDARNEFKQLLLDSLRSQDSESDADDSDDFSDPTFSLFEDLYAGDEDLDNNSSPTLPVFNYRLAERPHPIRRSGGIGRGLPLTPTPPPLPPRSPTPTPTYTFTSSSNPFRSGTRLGARLRLPSFESFTRTHPKLVQPFRDICRVPGLESIERIVCLLLFAEHVFGYCEARLGKVNKAHRRNMAINMGGSGGELVDIDMNVNVGGVGRDSILKGEGEESTPVATRRRGHGLARQRTQSATSLPPSPTSTPTSHPTPTSAYRSTHQSWSPTTDTVISISRQSRVGRFTQTSPTTSRAPPVPSLLGSRTASSTSSSSETSDSDTDIDLVLPEPLPTPPSHLPRPPLHFHRRESTLVRTHNTPTHRPKPKSNTNIGTNGSTGVLDLDADSDNTAKFRFNNLNDILRYNYDMIPDMDVELDFDEIESGIEEMLNMVMLHEPIGLN